MSSLVESASACVTVVAADSRHRWGWVAPAIAIVTILAIATLLVMSALSVVTDPMAGT